MQAVVISRRVLNMDTPMPSFAAGFIIGMLVGFFVGMIIGLRSKGD